MDIIYNKSSCKWQIKTNVKLLKQCLVYIKCSINLAVCAAVVKERKKGTNEYFKAQIWLNG